jgi:hypothetical protein
VTADHAGFARMLSELPDADLESTTTDYIWLAEFGPVEGRYTYELKRDQVVAECGRRDRMDLVEKARAKWPATPSAENH